MNKHPLSEKEFEIINIIADGFRSNQRDLSNHLDLSLGMTNLLLRRLVTKGYLRIKQLNRKKVQYLLAPRGIAEKARKTYHYTVKTIESFGLIKEELQRVLRENLKPETRLILVVGNGDLADLVQLLLLEFQKDGRVIEKTGVIPEKTGADTLILNALSEPRLENKSKNYVDLLKILSENINFRTLNNSTKGSPEKNVWGAVS